MNACSVDNCQSNSKRYVAGMCYLHWQRNYRTGSPHIARPRGQSRKQDPTYYTVHQWLKKDRGRASSHVCPCGESAQQWAYDHSDPNPKHSTEGDYSEDLSRYVAMCIPCHKRFDMNRLVESGWNWAKARDRRRDEEGSSQWTPIFLVSASG